MDRSFAIQAGSENQGYPWIVTWDDHEVDNDYANDRPEDGMPAAQFLLRRAAAYKAYYEHMPLPSGMRPDGPNMRLYTSLAWGTLANFHIVDGRQYRDYQACPKKPGGSTVVDPEVCKEIRDASRSMLGAQQEACCRTIRTASLCAATTAATCAPPSAAGNSAPS